MPLLDGPWPFRNDESSAWQVDFSPDGEVLALSSPETVGGIESLRVVATRDVGLKAAQEVVRDIRFWTIANDGQKIYFVRREQGAANLYMADFPTGAGVVLIQSNVRHFSQVGEAAEDKALAAAPPVKGIVVLGPESRVIAQMSNDLLHIYYVLDIINTARTPVDIGGPPHELAR